MPSRTVFFAKRVDEDYVIDIFDFIGSDFWAEGVTPRAIARALADAGDTKRIVVRLNSPGGDVFDGTAIYNLLRAQDGKTIRMEIHGLAASMASIIALAGDEVAMAEGAMYMIHNPWAVGIGESEDLRKTAGMLDKIKSNMLDIYMRRANVSREKVAEMMDDETWMTPTEAVKYGFADSVIADDEKAAASLPRDRAFAVLSRYTKTPAQLLSQLEGPEGISLVAAMSKQPQPKEKRMEREALIAALGLKPDATDVDILAACAVKNAPPSASDMVPRADLEAVRAQNATLLANAEKEKKEAFKMKVDAAVDGAVQSGKIPPVAATLHRKACMAGEEALKDFTDYIASAPVIASNTQMQEAERTRGGAAPASGSRSDDEAKVMRNLGVSADEMKKARADMRDDEESYPPDAYRYAM